MRRLTLGRSRSLTAGACETSTRSALNALAERDGTSADEVINAGLRALDRERRRRGFGADARRVAADPEDRAEVAAALRDVLGE